MMKARDILLYIGCGIAISVGVAWALHLQQISKGEFYLLRDEIKEFKIEIKNELRDFRKMLEKR